MRFYKGKIVLLSAFLVVGLLNVPAAHAASSMEIYFEPAYSGEPFKVAVTLGALPKQAMLKDICVLSGGANSFYPQSIRIVNMRGFWTFAPPPINQNGTYLVAFTCEGVFSVLNVEKTLVVIDRPTPTPTPTPVVVTPTPTPTPTPVVVTPTPTPTPTPVVVTPTPTPTPTPVPEPSIGLNPAVYIQCWHPTKKIKRSHLTRDNTCPSGYVRFFTNEELQRATGQTVAPTPNPAVAPTPNPAVAPTPNPAVAPTPPNTMTDKNGNTLVAPKDISIRCKSISTKSNITNVTGPNPKCPLNYRLLLPDDPEYNGPIGGVTSSTPVVSPTPTPDSVGTAPMPEYIWCVHRLTGRSVRSSTPYKPSCPKDYLARDYYGIPTDQVITPGVSMPSPSPLIKKVKVCYKSTDKKRVNGVKVFRESVTGKQPKCPAGYK